MDHVLQLHVEHHGSSSSSSSLQKRRDAGGGGGARFGKGADGDASSRAVLALAAVASLTLLFLSSSFSVVTTRTALFALSNAIFLLLAADCRRWFFSVDVADEACCEPAGDVADDACCEPAVDILQRQHRRQQHHLEAAAAAAQQRVRSCVPSQGGCLEHRNDGGAASEAFTEPVKPAIPDSTMAALEAPENEQQDLQATSSTPEELLRQLDNGGDATAGLETVVLEEPACETGQGLDELEIDELNKRFDEFIRSRRNKWVKEEACLHLQWHQALD